MAIASIECVVWRTPPVLGEPGIDRHLIVIERPLLQPPAMVLAAHAKGPDPAIRIGAFPCSADGRRRARPLLKPAQPAA
jgi:hypothetical protein